MKVNAHALMILKIVRRKIEDMIRKRVAKGERGIAAGGKGWKDAGEEEAQEEEEQEKRRLMQVIFKILEK